MKKFAAMMLALAMIVSLTACGGNEPQPTDAPTEGTKPTEASSAAPAEEPTETAEESTAETESGPAVTNTLFILNNAVADMEPLTDDLKTRYNAYWLDGYSVSKFAEDNFWFMPADDCVVSIMAYTDCYDYNKGLEKPLTWATWKDQYIALNVPEALKGNYPSGTACGLGMTKSLLPYQQGYIVSGAEAVVLMTDDEEGYVAKYLFEDLGMVDAESYEFHCGDGYVHIVDKVDLVDEKIYFDETGRVHANCLEYPDYPLMDIQFIVPEGLEKTSTPAAEGVSKINFMNNGIGVLDAAATKAAGKPVLVENATVKAPLGGTTQTGYEVAALLKNLEIPAADTVKVISFKDGFTAEQSYDAFSQKYIVMNDSKDRGPYTVGMNQDYGDVVTNAGYFVLGDNTLLAVPETCTAKESGIKLSDVLTTLGITGIVEADVVCGDGYTETVDAADFEDLIIFHNNGAVDTTSIAFPTYTLMAVAKIELKAAK